MLSKLTLLCLLVFFNFSTSLSQELKIDSSSARTLRIDPQNARGAKVAQLFDEVEFIPLETTKESLFGNVSQLKIVEGNFVFMDYDTKSVMVFTKEGKFRARINSKQMPADDNDKSPTGFWGYDLVEENNQQLIQIEVGKNVFYFNLDGKQIKKIPIKDYKYISSYRFSDHKTSLKEFYKTIIGKDTTNYQLAFVTNNKDTLGYFPYKNRQLRGGNGDRFSSTVADEYIYYNFYSYNLYKITPAKIALTYRVVFPAVNSLPKDFNNNPIYFNDVNDFFSKNRSIFYGIGSAYLFKDHLYLKMVSPGWDKNIRRSLVYNLKTDELISIEDLEADVTSYYLPVTDLGLYNDFLNYGFQLYDKGYLYTHYSSLAMFAFKEQSEGRKAKYPSVLENYFKTATKKSNPIIIKLKPKN